MIAARRASDLANQLLTHERAKGTNVAQAFVPVDINQLIHDLTEKRRPECAARGVTLKTKLAQGTPLMRGDAVLLGEAVLNLIDNSLTHAVPPATEITTAVEVTPTHLTLTFRDNGRGIPKARIAQAVERFVQLSDGPGSGLGLAIVKAVTEAHGGKLELQTAGDGFVARLIFPTNASS